MRQLFSILCVLFLMVSVCNNAEAQSLLETAKKAEQQAKELKQQELSRYNSIVDSRNLRKYEEFISDYPEGSYTQDIKERIKEIKLWDETIAQNTVSAYENYLNTTRFHWYDEKAMDRLAALRESARKREESDAWERIKNSDSIEEIEAFIVAYPNAPSVDALRMKLHELKGGRFYDAGDLHAAFGEFSLLSRDQISYSNQGKYDEVMEYGEYARLGERASEMALVNFMDKYPKSRYINQVSNKLAVVKAQKFGSYSTEDDYEAALKYALDVSTRDTVKDYISANKRRQNEQQKALRAQKRKQNGGLLNLGLNFVDAGLNGNYDDCNLWYYNIGLILRLGNFKDWAQFAIGIKPGILGYSETEESGGFFGSEENVTHVSFHMPIMAQLKLNLFKVSENTMFFLQGLYQFNAVRDSDLEGTMTFGGGIGLSWRNFDGSFNFLKEIGGDPNQPYFGLSISYFLPIL